MKKAIQTLMMIIFFPLIIIGLLANMIITAVLIGYEDAAYWFDGWLNDKE